jgi:pyrimidine operon attenuation protein / uracil phosphoribosyltransferase
VKTILDKHELELTIQRLCYQLIEDHADMTQVALIGLQPRGVFFSDRIISYLRELLPSTSFYYGKLDITFYRDDLRRELHVANQTDIRFPIEGKHVVLIDDVLYTGRTIRAALDAINDFGRPAKVSLCTLIERRFSRELPIQADYCGRSVDSLFTEKIKVDWQQERVILF